MLKFSRNILRIFLVFLVTISIVYIDALYTSPNQIFVMEGQTPKFNYIINANNQYDQQLGSHNVELKLFDFLPLKTVKVNVIPKIELIPCGTSIGLRVNTKGVMVVDTSKVYVNDTNYFEPYKNANIKAGDYIIELEGIKINKTSDINEILSKIDTNKELSIKILRDNNIIDANIMPIKSKLDGKYKLGLWIRDSSVGIGTMTFYDPNTNTFGALGHGIVDIDTKQLIEINNGELSHSNILSIKKGEKGNPGELIGTFNSQDDDNGTITQNTQNGVFGSIEKDSKLVPDVEPVEIGLKDDIKLGNAQIISSIDKDNPQYFDIKIEKIYSKTFIDSKSFLIKITDQRLLDKTGGIVQGMSGSPIIQNGKLVGAITHVLVNDPTMGYATSIETMLKETELVG